MSNSMKYVLTLLFIIGLQTPANTNKWGSKCEEEWPGCSGGKNIVCENTKNCGPRIRGCYQLDTTTDFRKRNLQHQNEKRNLVASGEETRGGAVKASNMHILNYDFGLEYTAICNANQCVMEHDKCRGTKRFPRAGQNLATQSSTKLNPYNLSYVEKNINNWYEEVAMEGFTTPIDKWVKIPGAGHFTALVWAETTHIGCGWSYLNSSSMATLFMSCNYGPGGNVHDWAMYKKGEPCTECASNETCSKKYTALCGEEDGKNLKGSNPYGEAPGIQKGFGIVGTLFVAVIVMHFNR